MDNEMGEESIGGIEISESPVPEEAVKKSKKRKRLLIVIITAAVGIFLILRGGKKEDLKNEEKASEDISQNEKVNMEEYRLAIQSRIAEICSEVSGVEKISAVVTLDGGFEYVYAADTKSTSSGLSTQYITIGSGTGEKVIYISEKTPKISGVGVVVKGVESPDATRDITYLISAAFGVPTNKIYVTYGK